MLRGNRIHQRRSALHLHALGDIAHLQRIGLADILASRQFDRTGDGSLEPRGFDPDVVGAYSQEIKLKVPGIAGHLFNRGSGLLVRKNDRGTWNIGATGIRYGSVESSRCHLREPT